MKRTINGVDCYGDMNIDQNISVVCANECDDGMWANGYSNWFEAVADIQASMPFATIVELEAC